MTLTSSRAVPDLTTGIRRITDFPSGCGGFADVYMAEWVQPRKGRSKVAVKVLRAGCSDLNNPVVNEKLEKVKLINNAKNEDLQFR